MSVVIKRKCQEGKTLRQLVNKNTAGQDADK